MVIDDPDIEGITVREAKTETPPIIYTHAPLTFAITAQGFQSVAGRNAEVFDGRGVV